MSKERLISTIGIVYFIVGLLFATGFAIYYKWDILSFLSPGFYMVVISWPLQVPGFVRDLLQYGLSGKPI